MNREIQIEIAKSWFELAKLLATIGGFVIVVAGILMAFMSGLISSSTNLVSSLDPDSSYNVEVTGSVCEFNNAISDALPGVFDGGSELMIVGMLIGISSIFFWVFGHYRLIKIKSGLNL